VESLKLLVDEFSNFARLPTAKPEPGDLHRIVAAALASYAGTEDVEFETDLDPTLPSVDLDADQIRRVLTNLIDNAIAAVRRDAGEGEQGSRRQGRAAAAQRAEGERSSRRPGRVTLRTVYDAPLQTVRLEVCDDGVGIAPDDRCQIFEPYFSTKQHGTGLGLAIVSRIIADHRGYIRVQDNEPHGTRFVIELPVQGV
jgi:two-component system nitrogen regulation sensor histidine kinase NtrY